MKVHDVNTLIADQPAECQHRRGIEFSLVQYLDGNRATGKHLADCLAGPQHTSDNAKAGWIQPRCHIPIQSATPVKSSVIANMVDHPKHVDWFHKVLEQNGNS